ncbi:MAG: hypothetical protein E7211_16670 [Clostridium lundense]|nr:hypothetical protein [Clostridium lundense]
MGFLDGIKSLSEGLKYKVDDLKLDAELKMMEWGVDDKVSKLKDNVIEKVSDLKFEAEMKIDDIKEKISNSNNGIDEKENVDKQHDISENNDEAEEHLIYKFGKYENVILEQCDTVFKEALAYEGIKILGDNLLDYDMKKDFEMTDFMMIFMGQAQSYDYILEDVKRYGELDTKNAAGNTIFDILACKFGFDMYSKLYSGIKEKSKGTISKGLFSAAKGLIDEVTVGGFTDYTTDLMKTSYKGSRNKIIGDYKWILRNYNLKPLQVSKIIELTMHKLISENNAKDEFETTAEYNKRLEDCFNNHFSEVFSENAEAIYETIKAAILEFNKLKTKAMLYSSYFVEINSEELSLDLYDADNECFKLKDGYNNYSLSVPRTIARKFKEKFSEIKPQCYVKNSLKEDKIILKWSVVYNFDNNIYFTEPLIREIDV